MLSLSINQNQFSDLLNLNYGVFLPLKNFVNEKNFKNILIKKKIDNKFFPVPIFFGIKKIDYNKIKNSTKIKIIEKVVNINDPKIIRLFTKEN